MLKPVLGQGTIGSCLPFQIQASYSLRNKTDTTQKTLVMLLNVRAVSGASSNSYNRNSKNQHSSKEFTYLSNHKNPLWIFLTSKTCISS